MQQESQITLLHFFFDLFPTTWTSILWCVDISYSISWWFQILCFVDHFTKYIWFYPFKHKSDLCDVFLHFKALVEKFFDHKIITIYSDNGGEYWALANFLSTHGISYLTTPPHTPKYNGYFERHHHHIIETSLSLLSHASLLLHFWSHAFAIAIYLINQMSTPTLQLFSPYEKLFGSSPNYSKLCVFGCLWLSLLAMALTLCYS